MDYQLTDKEKRLNELAEEFADLLCTHLEETLPPEEVDRRIRAIERWAYTEYHGRN